MSILEGGLSLENKNTIKDYLSGYTIKVEF